MSYRAKDWSLERGPCSHARGDVNLGVKFIAPRFQGRVWAIYLAACVIFACGFIETSEAQSNREHKIEAAFLFNLTRFIDWPGGTFADADTPFSIGVFGDASFALFLEKAFKNRTVNGREFVFTSSDTVHDLLKSQLLFVSASQQGKLSDVIAALGGGNILTVSDMEKFARLGGIIGFFKAGKKLNFEVNLEAAERAGLKISSKLLALGKVVK